MLYKDTFKCRDYLAGVVHEEVQVLMGGGKVLAQSQCRYYAHQRLVFLEHSAQGYAYLDLRLVK